MSDRLDNIDFSLTKREILIDTIMEFAGDEYDKVDSVLELAKKSEADLMAELENIKEYFENDGDSEDQIDDINSVIQELLTME